MSYLISLLPIHSFSLTDFNQSLLFGWAQGLETKIISFFVRIWKESTQKKLPLNLNEIMLSLSKMVSINITEIWEEHPLEFCTCYWIQVEKKTPYKCLLIGHHEFCPDICLVFNRKLIYYCISIQKLKRRKLYFNLCLLFILINLNDG